LNKILGSSLQKKNLIIMISMMGQVTTLLTHKFIVNNTKCNKRLEVVGAAGLLIPWIATYLIGAWLVLILTI
jgi:hypothetical protein